MEKRQCTIHIALYLAGNAAVWFRVKNSDFIRITLSVLKTHLAEACRPVDYAKRARMP